MIPALYVRRCTACVALTAYEEDPLRLGTALRTYNAQDTKSKHVTLLYVTD